MHRVATDRNITPTTQQQIDAGSGRLPSSDDEEEEAMSEVTPMRTETSLGVDPSGPSRRWDTFEDRLRQRSAGNRFASVRPAKFALVRDGLGTG